MSLRTNRKKQEWPYCTFKITPKGAPRALNSSGLVVLIPMPGDIIRVSVNYRLQLPLDTLGSLARKIQSHHLDLIDPDQSGAGLLSHDGNREECVWKFKRSTWVLHDITLTNCDR
jgi:hypothetical protein